MAFSPYDYFLWILGALLSALCVALSVRRGLLARLPSFVLYIFLVFANHGFTWWLFEGYGYASRTTFDIYWVVQGGLLVLRGAVIAELAWRVLRPYRGVWLLARTLLLTAAAVLVGWAAVSAWMESYWIMALIFAAKRGLELAAVVTIVSLLWVSRYYGIPLARYQRLLLLGLGLYSAAEVINFALVSWLLEAYREGWAAATRISYQVALVLWCAALWKPLPARPPEPELLGAEVYDRLAPQVSHRMRELNARLLEMLKG